MLLHDNSILFHLSFLMLLVNFVVCLQNKWIQRLHYVLKKLLQSYKQTVKYQMCFSYTKLVLINPLNTDLEYARNNAHIMQVDFLRVFVLERLYKNLGLLQLHHNIALADFKYPIHCLIGPF